MIAILIFALTVFTTYITNTKEKPRPEEPAAEPKEQQLTVFKSCYDGNDTESRLYVFHTYDSTSSTNTPMWTELKRYA